jgi:putative endonuclease
LTVRDARAHRGALAHQSGLSAEESVIRVYQERGYVLAHKRWRAKSGEIDLIFRQGALVVFVEVKKAGSFEAAAARLGDRQMRRIHASAGAFLADEPAGSLTEARFDVALVNGQSFVEILENAFCGE